MEKAKAGHRPYTSQLARKENLFKVLVLGDFEVGKSCLVNRYVHGVFTNNYKATQGVDFALKVLQWSASETVRLQLWDIAGQERFTSMTRLYYREAAACVIMFDVTNKASFLNSQKWKEDLDNKVVLSNGTPVPCILLANKCDLSPWAVTKEEIDLFSKENMFIGWTETSVKENRNINESMNVLVAKMMDNGEGVAALSGNGDYINLQLVPTPGYGCC